MSKDQGGLLPNPEAVAAPAKVEPCAAPDKADAVLDKFVERCTKAFDALFDAAKAKEEVQFAWALNPEVRGMQDAGWNTARESVAALDEYVDFINAMPPEKKMTVRVALSLYAHLSEASGLYEVPKNMMRIASGEDYNLWPFRDLVKKHAETGALIVPNANKVMRDLVGHARELKLEEFEKVILEAFDPDVRNGYAHADYVIWNDGIRLPKRNGGQARVVAFEEFSLKLNMAISFFHALREAITAAMHSYKTPRRVVGRTNKQAPAMPTIIGFDEKNGQFSIQSGPHL